MCFRNYGLPKTWLDKYQKSTPPVYPWRSTMVNGPKHCWNLNDGTFIRFIDQCESNWVWKKSLLVICKILRLLPNALTIYDKSSVLNRVYLTQPIHIQLFLKTKDFFSIFFCIFEIWIKFWTYSKKKMALIANLIPKLRTSQNVIR